MAHKFYNAAECKYEFVHTESVLVFYGSAHVLLNLKKNKQSLEINPGTPKKTWYVKCNKTIHHFILWKTYI